MFDFWLLLWFKLNSLSFTPLTKLQFYWFFISYCFYFQFHVKSIKNLVQTQTRKEFKIPLLTNHKEWIRTATLFTTTNGHDASKNAFMVCDFIHLNFIVLCAHTNATNTWISYTRNNIGFLVNLCHDICPWTAILIVLLFISLKNEQKKSVCFLNYFCNNVVIKKKFNANNL